LNIRKKSFKKATALALMEVASHAFLRGYNGQQETAPDYFTYFIFSYVFSERCLPLSSQWHKIIQSYMDYFVIFMPQK
jgi:hypothetical protein